jgi:hypothetical protein
VDVCRECGESKMSPDGVIGACKSIPPDRTVAISRVKPADKSIRGYRIGRFPAIPGVMPACMSGLMVYWGNQLRLLS